MSKHKLGYSLIQPPEGAGELSTLTISPAVRARMRLALAAPDLLAALQSCRHWLEPRPGRLGHTLSDTLTEQLREMCDAAIRKATEEV